jgi:putative SOS response-associated peptidase YedK
LAFLKWGQKTDFNLIINGRIEEITSKRTFAKIIDRRCVVIMEGYF